jgi:hypothetical protein
MTNIKSLLVQRLGVGGSGGNVGITSGLVGAGGLLEGLGGEEVGIAGGGVGRGVGGHVVVEGKSGEHREECLLRNACKMRSVAPLLCTSARCAIWPPPVRAAHRPRPDQRHQLPTSCVMTRSGSDAAKGHITSTKDPLHRPARNQLSVVMNQDCGFSSCRFEELEKPQCDHL